MTELPFLASVDWGYIGGHLFSEIVLRGVWMTLRLSVLGMLIGVTLGTAFALMRLSSALPLRWLAYFYIWFFRGTPLIVQIVFWFFALPQAWPSWAPWNGQMSPFTTAIVALAINEGAYMTEIMRAGIQSVDSGQMEAAKSLGMTYGISMRRIILPQAMRVVIPPTGNEFIAMLKNSSLVSVISVSEVFLVAKLQYSSSLLYFEWLIIASFWYLVLTTIGSVIQAWLERRYSTNYDRAALERTGLMRMLSFGGGHD
jgi:polar amino acid transport system permease protein